MSKFINQCRDFEKKHRPIDLNDFLYGVEKITSLTLIKDIMEDMKIKQTINVTRHQCTNVVIMACPARLPNDAVEDFSQLRTYNNFKIISEMTVNCANTKAEHLPKYCVLKLTIDLGDLALITIYFDIEKTMNLCDVFLESIPAKKSQLALTATHGKFMAESFVRMRKVLFYLKEILTEWGYYGV